MFDQGEEIVDQGGRWSARRLPDLAGENMKLLYDS
jgi:hypothetical protein